MRVFIDEMKVYRDGASYLGKKIERLDNFKIMLIV